MSECIRFPVRLRMFPVIFAFRYIDKAEVIYVPCAPHRLSTSFHE